MVLCRITIIFCLLLSKIFSLNQLDNMGGGLPAAGSSARIINDHYINLRNSFNDPNTVVLENFHNNLQNFLNSLNQNPNGNYQTLINRLTRIHENLQRAIAGPPVLAPNNSFRNILINVKKLVFSRLKRARIDYEVANGNNVVNGFGNLPANVQDALNAISGSIFHIIQNQNQIETIKRVGSGIALPALNIVDNQTVDLNNRNLTIVLTCAHVIKSNPKEKIEVYFVPDTELHPSGWPLENLLPNPLVAGAPVTHERMIQYLRSGARSFKISNFRLNNTTNQSFIAGSFEGHNPRYFNFEDVAIGDIHLRHGQANFAYNSLAPVNITLISRPAEVEGHIGNLRINQRNIFVTGRPGMHHHNINPYMQGNESNSYQGWVRNRGKSPRITSESQANPVPLGTTMPDAARAVGYPRVINNLIRHQALTSKGMSGGSLLSIDAVNGIPVIQVFGVVNSGNIDYNTAGFLK